MVKLGDVLLKTSTIKWSYVESDISFQYIDLTSVSRFTHKITETNSINSDNAPSRAQKIIRTGDVLFGTTRPTLNRFCVVEDTYNGQIASTGLCVLRANDEKILPKYIYYILTTPRFVSYVEEKQRGTSYPAVTDSDVKGFELDLPPLNEQQRIVAKLDAAFEKIDRAIEMNVINAQNSELLFTNSLEDIFSIYNTVHWQSRAVSDLGRVQTGTTPKTSEKANYGNYIPFIKPGDYMNDGTLNYQHDGLSEKGLRSGRLIPANSVLMVCIGATITKVGYSDREVSCNQQINAVSLDDELMSKFVYYQMKTSSFKSKILNEAPKTTLPIINKGKWSKLMLKIPPKDEVDNIVASLSVLSDKSVSLRKLYSFKSVQLKLLKTSMLHEAFSESAVK